VIAQPKPHLLHIFVSDEGFYEYSLDCPHDDEADRSCAVYEECTEHSMPPEPDSECPPYRWTDDAKLARDEQDHWLYAEDADPVAVVQWSEYDRALEAWEDGHDMVSGSVGFHRDDSRCWVVEWVHNDIITEGWDLVDFTRVEVTSPLLVRWSNRGGVDDSYLELSPWENDEKTHDA
jgi:hypothetical protein